MAGGGYRHFIDKNAGLKTKRTDDKDLVGVLKKAGYTTFISEKSTQNFMNYQPKAGEKVSVHSVLRICLIRWIRHRKLILQHWRNWSIKGLRCCRRRGRKKASL